MSVLHICAMCGKPFLGGENKKNCSAACSDKYKGIGYKKQLHVQQVAEAKEKRHPVRTDCRAYDPKKRDCIALNALWCTVEDCKFYKSKEDKQ